MKSIIAILSFLLLSCFAFHNNGKEDGLNLVPKERNLSFVISRVDNQITFYMKNVSEEEIYIGYPNCFGINIYPFMDNSDGEALQIKFRVKAFCDRENIRLSPSEIFEEVFVHDLDECFDYSQPGTYYLKLSYYGKIYNDNGEKITNDDSFFSNILEIVVN